MEFVIDSIYKGDCRKILKEWSDNCIDSIVTDPPYGLAFMGKGWDRGVPGCEFWAEALRVAKPGAHLLAFGGTRTYHRLACAIEDAGWEIRDCLGWLYGSGFPKSLDVSKAIDKAAGAKREKVPTTGSLHKNRNLNDDGWSKIGEIEPMMDSDLPATEAARQWQGWGTALKPAWEPIILARKPLIGTVAHNVLEHGTGGLNIDGCRIASDELNPSIARREAAGKSGKAGTDMHSANRLKRGLPAFNKDLAGYINGNPGELLGRWPANVIHDGSDAVEALFPAAKGSKPGTKYNGPKFDGDVYNVSITPQKEFSYGDSGSASRFFYCAKASRSERGEGNHHPTVKPMALMRYLCRLVTPPNGIVLDMFSGSGSTLVAAKQEGFHYIGCELEESYIDISNTRLRGV